MLKELTIDNYLLINHICIDFTDGLNTITGETGAGKSIILGAISLLFGAKGDISLLRDNQKSCVIEATFEVEKVRASLIALFSDRDIELDDEVVVRRIISKSGKSKFYVNQEPVNTAFVKDVGALLVDIHSQHQTLLLGQSDFQINILDIVSSNLELVNSYKLLFDEYRKSTRELQCIKDDALKSKRDEEYIRFQFEQLDSLKLVEGEESELNERYNILSNSQSISDNLYQTTQELNDSEESVISKLKIVKSAINKIVDYIPNGSELVDRVDNCAIELKDIYRECDSIFNSISFSDSELEEISSRLDTLTTMQIKHGAKSADELVAIREDYRNQLSKIENFDLDILEAEKLVELKFVNALICANKISANRKNSKNVLEKFVVDILSRLGMQNSQLDVKIDSCDTLNDNGVDTIQLLFSANKGVKCEPISKVASGGEMSRLMLALKALLSTHINMPTLIFDEIDTGVSGKVADEMGEIINDISANRQIINITHLPQIAAKGDTHLYVYKQHNTLESETGVRKLTHDERITEIATMLSGSEITKFAINHAKELLAQS